MENVFNFVTLYVKITITQNFLLIFNFCNTTEGFFDIVILQQKYNLGGKEK